MTDKDYEDNVYDDDDDEDVVDVDYVTIVFEELIKRKHKLEMMLMDAPLNNNLHIVTNLSRINKTITIILETNDVVLSGYLE